MKPGEQREKIGDIWYLRYAAAGGVVVDNDHVLLLRKKHAPEVRLPKGHIEPGETRQEAALREVAEETGYVNLKILADLGELTHTFRRDKNLVVTRHESFFLMTLADDTQVTRPPEDQTKFEILWVPMDTAEQALTYEVEREFLRRARRALARDRD